MARSSVIDSVEEFWDIEMDDISNDENLKILTAGVNNMYSIANCVKDLIAPKDGLKFTAYLTYRRLVKLLDFVWKGAQFLKNNALKSGLSEKQLKPLSDTMRAFKKVLGTLKGNLPQDIVENTNRIPNSSAIELLLELFYKAIPKVPQNIYEFVLAFEARFGKHFKETNHCGLPSVVFICYVPRGIIITASAVKWELFFKQDKKEKMQEEKMREEKTQEEKMREEKTQEEKMREEKTQEEKMREEKTQEEKMQEEKMQEEKMQEEKMQEEKMQEEKMQEEKMQEKTQEEKKQNRKIKKEKTKKEKEQKKKKKNEEKKMEEKKKEEKKKDKEMKGRIRYEDVKDKLIKMREKRFPLSSTATAEKKFEKLEKAYKKSQKEGQTLSLTLKDVRFKAFKHLKIQGGAFRVLDGAGSILKIYSPCNKCRHLYRFDYIGQKDTEDQKTSSDDQKNSSDGQIKNQGLSDYGRCAEDLCHALWANNRASNRKPHRSLC